MNMDAYRQRIARRRGLCRMAGCVSFLGFVLNCLGKDANRAFSLIAGVTSGFTMVVCVLALRLSRALKDDTALRHLYNEDHDERKQAIRAKAGVPMILFTSLGMIVAAVVASFFNGTVTTTLLVAAAAQMAAACVVKGIYLKRM